MTSKQDGSRTILYLLGAGCLIMIVLFVAYGYEKTWQLWNVPAFMPYLADARVITAGAETHALGADPLIPKSDGSVMNYPRIWQLLFYLGLNQSDTIYFGVTFALLFLLGLFLISRHIDKPTAWLMTCAVFSPAVLLGLERGNNDLVVFFLLALAVYAADRSRIVTTAVIGLAFLLKLYPIFALAIFLRETRRVFLTIMVFAMVVCGVYTIVTFDDLRLIRLATPRPTGLSYGMDVVWMRVGHVKALGSAPDTEATIANAADRIPHAATALRLLSYSAVLLTAVLSLLYAGRRNAPAGDYVLNLDSFRVGAAVYIGTFLIGANFDYRLMMLLLVIPQLMGWRRNPWSPVRYIAIATTASILISLWTRFTGPILGFVPGWFLMNGVLGAFSKWIIFAGLLYLFVYSWPDWLKSLLSRATETPGAVILPQTD